ncbi:glycosyltransferase family 2 protein [Pseudomonas rhodesiae]|uniref:glycosyltransferase family 2 protein n=1 Tax=Pseudomonas rhodesiae TaxID=76760 RepID=UPI001F44ED9A|nr:glycosyltransferase family 2 protein [Pseudomonas rhodesiae]
MNSNKKTDTSQRLEGGKRLAGDDSASKARAGLPLISIVTVVFNDVKNLQRTIDSISSQSYENLEHIVIDGFSWDGTLDVIKNNSSIDYWLSEKDGGIYDAMNKGISAATGQWINFMNSGDVFFNSSVLSDVFNGDNFSGKEMIYGDVEVDYGEFKKIKKSGSISSLKQGMQFSHQSLFAARSLLAPMMFDVSYRTAADYDFIIRAWRQGATFHYVNTVISSVSSGGVSDVRRVSSHQQRVKILNSSLDLSTFDKFKLWLQSVAIFASEKIRSIFPAWLLNWIRKVK